MDKQKLNAEIALHFGFKKSKGQKFLISGKYPQWTYPDDWYLAQGGYPNTNVPDFIQIIEDYLELHKKHSLGCPREHFNDDEVRSTST